MKEKEIRPKELLDTYLKLSKDDSTKVFSNSRKDINCVGCNSKNTTYKFSKNGFNYNSCNNCNTLYQTPRPSISEFHNFYSNSKSSKFWAEKFFPTVEKVRTKKIIRPKARKLSNILKKLEINPKTVLDEYFRYLRWVA